MGRNAVFIIALALIAEFESSVALALEPVPAEIKKIFDKPAYRDATWEMRVVDLETGRLIYALNSERLFLIGSVRKLFSIGVALDSPGTKHRFHTAVHRQGKVTGHGILNGDLILVASGDLAMGGRTKPDGTLAITDVDHNEANSLGNAELTTPDPLAGYKALAEKVAAAGIKRISGEVIIDDRLFEPFNFRDQFDVKPIFVNDDLVDVIINPGKASRLASVDWRPKSAAFSVQSSVKMVTRGGQFSLDLDPELANCIGIKHCLGTVKGTLPVDFAPPLTNRFPLIQTFRITQPSNYARTVFIEALEEAGISIAARPIAPNPVRLLPKRKSYTAATRVAQLVSSPYSDYAKFILKVSYNIGADTSLMLFGLTKGATTLAGALAAELKILATEFAIPASQVHFVDGSGGGLTSATGPAVINLLEGMSRRASFPAFLDALPRLGVDGPLAFVTDFEADPTLAGAKGRVHAKPGTYVVATDQGLILKAQALAGYIDAKSGRRLVFIVAVDDVKINDENGLFSVSEDQGTISAILWKEL